MELEEAIKILKDYLCKTHSEYCKVGAVGLPNKEYFATETVLNHLTKQDKMIEYMVNWINDHEDPFEGCHENEKCGDDYISCEQCIKQYFEKKAEES